VTDQGRDVAVAADGSVYVTGLFTAGVEFIGSGIKLSSRGAGDSFVARYNPNDQLIWALRAGGTAGDIGLGLAVEGNGNAVVTGNFSGQATFADIDSPAAATLTSAGRIDGFVTKYDPQGQLLWARRAGGSGNDSGRGVAVDSAGEVYVSGSFSALASFPSPGSSAELSSAGAEDLFVARYSPDGNLRWAQRAGGASTNRALAITIDQQQNSYLTGFFTAEATFGTLSLEGQGKEIFLAKLSPDGAFLQAKSAGG